VIVPAVAVTRLCDRLAADQHEADDDQHGLRDAPPDVAEAHADEERLLDDDPAERGERAAHQEQ